MTTVINNPGESDNGLGWVVGVVLVVILLVVFFVYALPAIQKNGTDDNGGATIKVELPSNDNSGGSNTQ